MSDRSDGGGDDGGFRTIVDDAGVALASFDQADPADSRALSELPLPAQVRARFEARTEDDDAPTVAVVEPRPPDTESDFDDATQRLERERSDSIDAMIAVVERESAPAGQFGPYTLLGEIGSGGMASVELALERRPDGNERLCVVKRIRGDLLDQDEVQAMFDEERRVGALLDHPNIVRQFDAGQLDGVEYLAMEFVDGLSAMHMMALVAPSRIPVSVGVDIGIAIADALEYAKLRPAPGGAPLGLIHRDVTPHNILLSRDGEVKLADFGIARFYGRDLQTQAGLPKGKQPYMAPEHLMGEPLDQRVDLFALGCVLLELWSGRPLVPDGVLGLTDLAPEVRVRCAEASIDGPLRALLISMTSISRSARPRSAGIVAKALRRVRTTLTSAEDMGEFVRRIVAESVPANPAEVLAAATDSSRSNRLVEGLVARAASHRDDDDVSRPATTLGFIVERAVSIRGGTPLPAPALSGIEWAAEPIAPAPRLPSAAISDVSAPLESQPRPATFGEDAWLRPTGTDVDVDGGAVASDLPLATAGHAERVNRVLLGLVVVLTGAVFVLAMLLLRKQ